MPGLNFAGRLKMNVLKKLKPAQVHLEAECADTRVGSFIAEYQAITGIPIKPGTNFQVQPSAFDRKRGLEGRVYLNVSPAEVRALLDAGLRVQGPRSRGYLSDKYSYRIDKNSLFWDLVKLGHRL